MKLVKRKEASGLILTMLIWSVVGVLGTRLFLMVMGNPIIGRGQWHVAHMLFGGTLMMFAMMINLIFEGEKLEKNVVVIFGLGWGLFIDEIGKYLTKDNNYWFRPAIMIIYISFVMMFLIYKYLERKTLVQRKNGKISRTLSATVDIILKKKIFTYGLWIYSIYYSMDKIIDVLRISTSPQKLMMIEKFNRDYNFFGTSDMYMIVFKMIFETIASILFLLGASYFWSKKRSKGLRFFKYGLYVSILLGSIFKFYFEQLGAVADVVVSLILLEILGEYRRKLLTKKTIFAIITTFLISGDVLH